MLTVHKLSKSFNLTPILQDVTFSVNGGDRVGLIGPNGSGKTTLLRIIAGDERPDGGHIQLSPGSLRVGYLPQGFDWPEDVALGDLIHRQVGDPAQLEADLAQLGRDLAAHPNDEQLQQTYDRTLQRLMRADGSHYDVLTQLGIDAISAEMPVHQLSGGQKTRLGLALLLLDKPDLLLLDEPTNHLDIGMLEWLEAWLDDFAGGVLFVSHDRTFLDRIATRILDLNPANQQVREYEGNYSDYLAQYLNERDKQWQAYRDQVYEIRRMKQDINRTAEQARHVERTTKPNQPHVRRLAKKVAKKAKAREKKLDRYLESDERVDKPQRSWQMKLDFEEAAHLGRDVIMLDELAVGYPGHAPLLTDIHANVRSGSRIALTGENGSGKTTLLRTIAGELAPRHGRVRLGKSVVLGVMSQEQEGLDPTLTPLDTIQRVAPLNQTDARSFLHYFLFAGDDAIRPNHLLSYGERARLSLAKLIASGCNLLLLDEPVNHLDIPSRTQFEQALSQFDGTILAVIHDRYLIDRFATEVWWVKDGSISAEIRDVAFS